MAKKALNVPQIHPIFQEQRSHRVAEHVRSNPAHPSKGSVSTQHCPNRLIGHTRSSAVHKKRHILRRFPSAAFVQVL
jgi:hypothetical protein